MPSHRCVVGNGRIMSSGGEYLVLNSPEGREQLLLVNHGCEKSFFELVLHSLRAMHHTFLLLEQGGDHEACGVNHLPVECGTILHELYWPCVFIAV